MEWITGNIVAILALLGTAITAYLGYRSRRVMSGDREADQEREIREELRSDIKTLKEEVKGLAVQNKQQAEDMAALADANERKQQQLEDAIEREKQCTEKIASLQIDVQKLGADVLRQAGEITGLKRRRE